MRQVAWCCDHVYLWSVSLVKSASIHFHKGFGVFKIKDIYTICQCPLYKAFDFVVSAGKKKERKKREMTTSQSKNRLFRLNGWDGYLEDAGQLSFRHNNKNCFVMVWGVWFRRVRYKIKNHFQHYLSFHICLLSCTIIFSRVTLSFRAGDVIVVVVVAVWWW